jgi:DNA-binding transcriptional ArsR family regulator
MAPDRSDGDMSDGDDESESEGESEEHGTARPQDSRVTVEAPTVNDVAAAINAELAAPEAGEQPPVDFSEVVETLSTVYRGLEIATEQDERGRMRKKVQQFAGMDEEVSADTFGHHLRVLEAHGLAVQDGNRWRIADEHR